MKYSLKAINPKQLFHLKSKDKKPKSPDSLSKSSPPSFGSTTSSTSSTSSSSSSGSQHSALGLDDPARCAEDQVKVPGSDPTMEFHFDVGQAFKMIDRDGDGKITRGEMESLFKRVVGTTDEELAEMIKEIDRDGDGCISLEELTAVGFVFESTAAKGVPEEELRGAFDFFDGDHDGKISAEELFQGFIALGDERCTLEECRRMIESVDVNKDGFVCFEDFSRMMDVIPR